MKTIDNEYVRKKLLGKKAIGITEDEIRKAVNESNVNPHNWGFYIYSVTHYQILYHVFKKGMDKYEKTEDKKVYLKCLKYNYSGLMNTDDLDIIIYAISGGYLGSNILESVVHDKIFSSIFVMLILIMIAFKFFIKTNRRFHFYREILNDIEKELDKTKE